MGQRIPHHAKKTKKYKNLILLLLQIYTLRCVSNSDLMGSLPTTVFDQIIFTGNRGSQPERGGSGCHTLK
jgi:hypothetical protein